LGVQRKWPGKLSAPRTPIARSNKCIQTQESGDLSFSEGETIEIIEETNADWWKGKNSRGQIGLFPANYVEKVAAAPPAPGRMVAPIPSEKMGYSPAPYMAPPPPVVQADATAPPEQPKKSRFGKLGNTVSPS